jgi:ABC-type multidrug transport system ATPase subunit
MNDERSEAITVRNLVKRFNAALYGLKKRERSARARKLLNDFGLSNASKRKFGSYSKGKEKLDRLITVSVWKWKTAITTAGWI